MKKNLLIVIILTLSIINIILSAIIVFVVVPSTTRTNKLVNKVASIVGMELEMYQNENERVDISDISSYQVVDGLVVNLKRTGNKDHYALVSVTLSINKNHKDTEKLSPLMEENNEQIKEIIIEEISKYDINSVNSSIEQIKSNTLEEIHKLFDSNFIINISFGNMTLQ